MDTDTDPPLLPDSNNTTTEEQLVAASERASWPISLFFFIALSCTLLFAFLFLFWKRLRKRVVGWFQIWRGKRIAKRYQHHHYHSAFPPRRASSDEDLAAPLRENTRTGNVGGRAAGNDVELEDRQRRMEEGRDVKRPATEGREFV
jgi:hypothetical protein